MENKSNLQNVIICGIYKITNKINNKVYIGQSIDIYERWKEYFGCINDLSCNRYIHRAIRKYGLENFNFEIIKECKREELNYFEIYYIDFYKSTFDKFGYNITPGGQSIDFNTENGQKIRKRVGASLKTHYKEVGTQSIKDGWKKLKESNHYNDYLKKQKETHLGKKFSEESLRKRKDTRLEKGLNKKVKCVEDNLIFESIKDCEKYYKEKLGINRVHVNEVVNGKRSHDHGLHFVLI